jgi:hypothetical protein
VLERGSISGFRNTARRDIEAPKTLHERRIEDADPSVLANTTVLSGDLASAIGALKGKPGDELQSARRRTLSGGCSRMTPSTRCSLLIFP